MEGLATAYDSWITVDGHALSMNSKVYNDVWRKGTKHGIDIVSQHFVHFNPI